MADLFLESLRADWKAAPPDLAAIANCYTAHRRGATRRIYASYAGATIVTGLFFLLVWMAIAEHSALLGVAALAFLAGSAISIVGAVLGGYQAITRYDDTPVGHLREIHHGMETEHRLLWGARWVARVLVLSIALAIGVTAFGYAPARDIVVLALTWGLTAIAVWLWQSWRAARLERDMEHIAALLADMESADEPV